MKTKTFTNFATVLVAAAVGTSSVLAAKTTPEPPLSEAGKKLEARYAGQMEALKEEIAKAMPSANAQKKAAFLKGREAEVAAENAVVDAQKHMGEVATANALVGHAKGKWIGGADKGIAAAKAKLKRATTAAESEAAQKELEKWQQNRKDGENALKERQANLDRLEEERPQLEKALKDAEQALAQAKATTLKAVKDFGLKSTLSSGTLDAKLAKYVVLLQATPRGLAAFAQQGKKEEELIDKMLSAGDFLVQMAVADGARDGKYGRAMEIYRDIWNASDKVAEGPLRQLALAISLEHAAPIKQRNAVGRANAPEFVDPVKRYLHYEKALLDGELDPAFKDLSTWDYRMVVNGEEPDEILAWGREMLRNYRPDHVTMSDYRWRYDRDLDFLATTQARMAGDRFLQVKRAQWIGDVMGEPRVFGFQSRNKLGFWYGVSLYTQRGLIADSKAKTLAAVGEDIGEANVTKEKIELTKVTMTEKDRKVTVDGKGVITIPAAATSKPTKSTGKIIFMDSVLGGKQLHYSRNGGGQSFEYTVEAPAGGNYQLTARVATPSWKQSLLVTANDAKRPVAIALPHTVGMWDTTAPVVIELAKGKNVLRFSHKTDGYEKGVSIKGFTLTPISGQISLVPKGR